MNAYVSWAVVWVHVMMTLIAQMILIYTVITLVFVKNVKMMGTVMMVAIARLTHVKKAHVFTLS